MVACDGTCCHTRCRLANDGATGTPLTVRRNVSASSAGETSLRCVPSSVVGTDICINTVQAHTAIYILINVCSLVSLKAKCPTP